MILKFSFFFLEKFNALCTKLGFYDWQQSRRRLEFLRGRELSPSKVTEINKTPVKIAHYDELPSEEELDRELRDIFSYYVDYGDKGKMTIKSLILV